MKSNLLALTAAIALLAGCGKYDGVSPSQNPNLAAISPSSTSSAEGGFMQRSLDTWLKDTWEPMMADKPTEDTKTESDGTQVITKTEPTTKEITITAPSGEEFKKTLPATLVTTTVVKPSGETTTTTETVVIEDDEPFTLQKYVDKWSEYLERKKALGIESPESNVKKLNSMPVIGK